jgi:hypothetical protein
MPRVGPRTISIARLRRSSHSSRSRSASTKVGVDVGGAEWTGREASDSGVPARPSLRPFVEWEPRVGPRTISIARLRRTSHSSRSLPPSDGTNVGGVVWTSVASAGHKGAGGAELIGSGSAGGNALSGRTKSGRSQSEHRKLQCSALGTNVVLSSPDCPNRNSTPHAIQRIALALRTTPTAAYHRSSGCRWAVGT